MKKILFLLSVMMINASLSMAQVVESAKTIRNKVADYAKKQGMAIELVSEQALTMTTDDSEYVLIVNGENPTYVELRFADLDITARNYNLMLKTANHINQGSSVVKASITPNRTTLRLSTEMFAFDAQSVTEHFEHYIKLINQSLKECRERYDEFAANLQFTGLKMPFEVYCADIINADANANRLSEINGEIKSAETQYVHIGLSLTVHEDGEYPIDVRFCNPDGTFAISEENAEYSFSTTMKLTKDMTFYDLGGWGSATPGSLKPGIYRYELYYKGKLFYTRGFEVQ